MNRHFLYLAPLAFVMASCETGNVISSGNFDPLTPPGSSRTPTAAVRGLKPGSWVRASMEAAFFKSRPGGGSTAEKMLPANTEMKVITDDGSYAKVELTSGEVGYVPSVLIGDPSAQPQVSPNAIQVYPPVPGSVPPVIDPNTPTIAPVIDPDAPMVTPEVIPDVAPVPEAAPAPLPPGNEAEDEPKVEQ
jgi:hypothetical protein